MRRREFIALLGGVATWTSVAARAQQQEHMRRIGVLNGWARQIWKCRLGMARSANNSINWDGSRVATFISIIAGAPVM